MNHSLLYSKIGAMLLIITAIMATIFFPPEVLGDNPFLKGPVQSEVAFSGPSLTELSEPALAEPSQSNEPEITAPESLIPFPSQEVLSNHSPSTCNSRFWIVSSRNMEQKQIQPGHAACLQYFECSGCSSMQTISREQYLQTINPDIPVCFIVHGSFTKWDSFKGNTYRIVNWLSSAAPERPMQYIFYTWPSESKVPLMPRINILQLGTIASNNGFYLAHAICEIPGNSRMTLIGHSHGSRISSSALHLLGNGDVEGNKFPTDRDNQRQIKAVFLAAAIDHHWLNPGKRFHRAIHRAEAILVLVNKKDWALSLYPFRRVFSNRALSKTGFTKRDKRELGYLTHKLYELDVTENIEHGHFLVNYFEDRSIANSIAPFVNYMEQDNLHTPQQAAN